ncbi:DMT family transporter [Paracoccus sp. (in: a-proteobacteria)]|uniref:DMT family transporter n=1 Tax=Paracoccus sp. TaxID=267 RepID=UPI0026E03F24|nr:DMT family transporter [Paracoccus sp. (in: a-proteobacteria)]MDO5646925.1 DMT family transporter [Paracoccus sp. (in: a-proteobacteria)]
MTTPPSDRRVTVALMVAATALFASTSLLAKAVGSGALGPALHPLMVSAGRFVFAFIAVATVVAAIRPRLTRPDWRTHITRTICGWVGISLMFAAVAQMPLPDATAISFLSPVFTMLLAIPLLGERVGPVRWSAAGIALLGAVILLRPAGDIQMAAFFALGAAVAMGTESIFIKRLAVREQPLQVLFINNGIGAVIASVAVMAVLSRATPAQWGALMAIGGLIACGQALNLLAMRRDDASFVVPFFYLTLIWAALFDLWWFEVLPDGISLIGAAVIIAGALLLVLRDRRRGGAGVMPSTQRGDQGFRR